MKVVYKSHVNMNKLKTVKISFIISGVLKTHGVKAVSVFFILLIIGRVISTN